MSARFLGGVLLALGWAAPAAAQPPVSPLDRLVDVSIRLFTTLDDCTVPRTVFHLAHRFEIVAGIEYLQSPCAKFGSRRGPGGPFVDLYGLTVRDALAKVLAIDARYRMFEYDGVVVVRPVQALTDRKNVLNFTTSSFVLVDATLGMALDSVLSGVLGEPRSEYDRFGTSTEQGARRFSVKTGAVSVTTALDAFVGTQGAAIWEVRAGDIGRLVPFYTFDGAGMGASRRGLQ